MRQSPSQATGPTGDEYQCAAQETGEEKLREDRVDFLESTRTALEMCRANEM